MFFIETAGSIEQARCSLSSNDNTEVEGAGHFRSFFLFRFFLPFQVISMVLKHIAAVQMLTNGIFALVRCSLTLVIDAGADDTGITSVIPF